MYQYKYKEINTTPKELRELINAEFEYNISEFTAKQLSDRISNTIYKSDSGQYIHYKTGTAVKFVESEHSFTSDGRVFTNGRYIIPTSLLCHIKDQVKEERFTDILTKLFNKLVKIDPEVTVKVQIKESLLMRATETGADISEVISAALVEYLNTGKNSAAGRSEGDRGIYSYAVATESYHFSIRESIYKELQRVSGSEILKRGMYCDLFKLGLEEGRHIDLKRVFGRTAKNDKVLPTRRIPLPVELVKELKEIEHRTGYARRDIIESLILLGLPKYGKQ